MQRCVLKFVQVIGARQTATHWVSRLSKNPGSDGRGVAAERCSAALAPVNADRRRTGSTSSSPDGYRWSIEAQSQSGGRGIVKFVEAGVGWILSLLRELQGMCFELEG